MGWLCISDQLDSSACAGINDYWTFFSSYLCRLLSGKKLVVLNCLFSIFTL